MDKETIKDSENINSDEWKFLLLMMLMEVRLLKKRTRYLAKKN